MFFFIAATFYLKASRVDYKVLFLVGVGRAINFLSVSFINTSAETKTLSES